mgnify:FL=1
MQLEEERERERVEREEAASKEEDEGKRKVCVPCSSARFAQQKLPRPGAHATLFKGSDLYGGRRARSWKRRLPKPHGAPLIPLSFLHRANIRLRARDACLRAWFAVTPWLRDSHWNILLGCRKY